MLCWHSPEWTVYYFSQYWYQTNQSVILYIILLIYLDHVGNHQLFDIVSDCQSVLKSVLVVERELIHFKTPGVELSVYVGLKTFLVWRFNRCGFTFWFVSFDKLFSMSLLFKHIVWGIAVLLDARGYILSPSLRNPVILHIVCLSRWSNSI